MLSQVGESTFRNKRSSFFQKSLKIMGLYGRVAQLGEHLLCKHVFISPKSLNWRLLIVQTPLLVGLLNGLQMSSERYRKNDLGLLFGNRGNDS
jgi:hypothetical protein